jgi:hypothetical protein
MPALNITQVASGSSGRVSWTSSANETIVIAGNSSVSNVAVNTENVVSAVISKVWFSTNTGITVTRGSNVVLNLIGSSFFELYSSGIVLN